MSSKIAREPAASSPRPWSLAARLTAWYAGSAFVLLLVVTGFLYWGLATSLEQEDDEELADKVRVLRAMLHERPGDLTGIQQQARWGWQARLHAQVHMRLLDRDGRIAFETTGMDMLLPVSLFPVAAPEGDDLIRAGKEVYTEQGKPFRLLAAQAAGFVIQMGLDRSYEGELLADYRRNLWLVLGAAFAVCMLTGYAIARRGLQPVARMSAMTRRIRPSHLSERLVTSGLPSELLDQANTFNAMLDRLEESFGRLAQFSADIAHELRTPVNNLRGEVEVALGRARAPEEYRDVLGSCLEDCAQLARLIDSLLFLARAENPKTQIERERVEINRELKAIREFYEPAAGEAGIELAMDGTANASAELCRPLLQRALGNLIENALAHTPRGGTITVGATATNDLLRLEVADTGIGIPEEHLPHLFSRFYRVGTARSGAPGGAGLGLAIVKSIAELHGGTVEITSRAGQGTRVSLLIPSRASSPSRAAPTPAQFPG